MHPIRIRVTVPIAAAVARGSTSYGQHEIVLSDNDVAALSDAAKSELCLLHQCQAIPPILTAYCENEIPGLELEAPNFEHLAARLAERAAARFERTERPKREQEARITAALAKSDDEWIAKGTEYYLDTDDVMVWRPVVEAPVLWQADLSDPRISDRTALVTARSLPVRDRAWLDMRDQAETVKRAATEREAAAQSRYREALKIVAAQEDDLARAASEGYDVQRAVLNRLAVRLIRRMVGSNKPIEESGSDGDIYWSVDTTAWKDPQDRAAPSPDAFALLDRVNRAVNFENQSIPVAIGSWEVSRIVRVDTCPQNGCSNKITAVLATLCAPNDIVREITFSLEAQDCDHEERSR